MTTNNNNTKLTTAQLTEKIANMETRIQTLQKQISTIRDDIFSINANTPRAVETIAANIINRAINNERSKQPIPPSNN